MSRAGRDGNPMELVVARGHERDGRDAVVRNIREHPIDRLLERGAIEAYHHQAAEQLMSLWERSQISADRAAKMEPSVDGGRPTDLTLSQADAIGRVRHTFESLSDVDRLIVTLLVLERKNLEEIGALMRARGHRWPPKRYGGPRVCEALHSLAVHYGLVTARRP